MGLKGKKDVLVALLKDKNDYYYADVEHWYRIPAKSKRVPLIVKEKKVKIIAFYFPKTFGLYAHTIRYYANVKNISLVKRDALVLDEKKHPRSDEEYYKIEIDKLTELKPPIESLRKRRLLFISTTQNHLFKAKEINDLYYESPLEEKLWDEFKKLSINAERQWEIILDKRTFYTDFALFCKARNIAIECDGDTYHMKDENVEKDKHRDNLLYNAGWDVRRFTSKNLNEELEQSVGLIKEAVNKYGGLEKANDPRDFEYIRSQEEKQMFLFDK
ncbi:DUF559 domain-containing protein [Bacteroidetes/Chlorobi group bacterium ChocPot_Mid]|nr:MAG: DUF559 domain-containing protein [Bacteroidetes/Chlorobi group bacterium ChocPot_Mid]